VEGDAIAQHQVRQRHARLGNGLERRLAGGIRPLLDGKDRQDTITDEFQNLAAMSLDRGHQTIEIPV